MIALTDLGERDAAAFWSERGSPASSVRVVGGRRNPLAATVKVVEGTGSL